MAGEVRMSAGDIWTQIQQMIRQGVRQEMPFGLSFAKITADATTQDTVEGVTVTLCKAWVDGEDETAANKVDVVVPVGTTVAQDQRWVVLWTSRQPRVGILLVRYA